MALSDSEPPIPSSEEFSVDWRDDAGICETRDVSALESSRRGAFGDTGELCPEECGVSVDFCWSVDLRALFLYSSKDTWMSIINTIIKM